MSVTVVSLPVLLLFQVAPLAITAVATTMSAINEKSQLKDMKSVELTQCDFEKITRKDFETTIMDKETLIKTLEEYGAQIASGNDNEIVCTIQQFDLIFTKKAENKPFKLRISYNKKLNPDELIGDISSEYCKNAQEISYNKIKERLEQQNMTIEEEEIYDDDTIVLTVNLD